MGNRSPVRLLRRVFHRDPAAEVDDELEFHLEERIRDHIARGMEPDAARKAALERLGDLDRVRTECTGSLKAERRAHQRRIRLNLSWLDVKLGIRMLAKYPGLSLVSVLGMAVAIAIGAGYFGVFGALLDTTLPLEEGDRVVSILKSYGSRPGPNYGASVRDFLQWREELKSVRELGAFHEDGRNVITADVRTDLVRVAAMTASGFELTRVAPMLGRTLLDQDERAGAPPVLVIGYGEWQRRFDGDPDILGQSVRLGETLHTVVGVMPEGFGFPIQHRYWVPLRLNVLDDQPGAGPSLFVFGRLADGFSLTQARAELATIGRRMAVAFPETHEHLRSQVLPYAHAFSGPGSPEAALAVRAVQLVVSLLLVIVAVNVAILVYARTVTRTGEIAVRSALGASRRRVVTQLFVEALVLSVAASAIGLTLAAIAFGMLTDFHSQSTDPANRRPFWLELGLSPGLIVYVASLAIVAGVIIGVVPALKATGRRLHHGLQQFSTRGSAMQLGRTWTALIIVQVAVTVAALPAAVNYGEQLFRLGTRDPAVAANDLLRATLVMPREAARATGDSATYEQALRARFADRVTELMRRLEAEPEVSAVTFARNFPGTRWSARIEAEAHEAAANNTGGQQGSVFFWAGHNDVAIDLFDVFDVPILAGRGFVAADAREGATAVIITETFAEQIAGGANVLGRRIRYAPGGDGDAEASPWLEIVGVVPDFGNDFTTPNSFDDDVEPRLYHAAATGQTHPAALVVQVRGGEPASFATRLRDIAATVDPTLRLERLETVVGAWDHAQQALWSLALGIGAVMLSVLLLSAAGIYAMMSFTVARRRREIGIRSALGASPRRVLTGIFARAGAQLGIGVLAGLAFTPAFDRIVGDVMGGDGPRLILMPGVAALMLSVGLLAALGPARRGLAVQPTEALRQE